MTSEELMKYVEERLYQWAEWYSRSNFCGLGYPPYSLEYRIMREGTIVRSTGPRPLPCNDAAEEIESLVVEMAQQNFNMAIALRCHYFNRGSLRSKSKKLNVSYTQYRHYVELAHQWLIGRLTSKPLRPIYY